MLGAPVAAKDRETLLFARFSGIQGDVVDKRHTGWIRALSWAPAMPKGQRCTEGSVNCLNDNGHRITVLRAPDATSQALGDAAVAGTRFDEVKLEIYGEIGSDYWADTLTFQGVRIEAVAVKHRLFRRVEVLTLVYERKTGHTSSWSEAYR